MHVTKQKNLNQEAYLLHNSSYVTFSKRIQYKDHWLPGVGMGEEVSTQGTDDVGGGSEDSLCDTIIVDSCQYTFVQIHRMYNAKSESSCETIDLG